jgi:hypothetical protein
VGRDRDGLRPGYPEPVTTPTNITAPIPAAPPVEEHSA